MLLINDLTYRVAGRMLLDQASVVIPDGHRVAIVGRNGTGKSTLLKLIAGELQPDGGDLRLNNNARMGWVRQEAPSDSRSLIETVLAADTERASLLEEAETATDPQRISEIHERLFDIEAHSAEGRAAKILSGLGFDADAQRRPCSDFSGGWRMRVALAAVLFTEPDLLLLDEPTNHLDLEATLWLEDYLKAYPRTMIIVSHDRELLNKVPTTIVHLDRLKLTSYSGNYDTFVKTRTMQLELLKAQAAKQETQRKHLQSFVDRFKAKASKARQAQSRVKAIERLGPRVTVLEDETTSFSFPSPDELAPPLINLDNVTVGYGDKPVLRGLGLRIDSDDRIALLGANGNGKSTLVKLLAGKLAPMSGEVKRSGKLRVGYFAQHQTDELNTDWTPIQQLATIMPQANQTQLRGYLGRFGLGQQKAETKIAALSGGEKAKLLLAMMTREAPHVLMLDEPTNHLDIDSREALVEALNEYEGAVIVISHDPHLIELTADRLVLVADGTAKPFDGDLEDYKKLLLENARAANREAKADAKSKEARKEEKRAAAELRAQMAPVRRELEQAEKKLAKLTAKRTELSAKLADPAIYNGPADKVTQLQIEMGTLEKQIEEVESQWLNLSEQLEQAGIEAAA